MREIKEDFLKKVKSDLKRIGKNIQDECVIRATDIFDQYTDGGKGMFELCYDFAYLEWACKETVIKEDERDTLQAALRKAEGDRDEALDANRRANSAIGSQAEENKGIISDLETMLKKLAGEIDGRDHQEKLRGWAKSIATDALHNWRDNGKTPSGWEGDLMESVLRHDIPTLAALAGYKATRPTDALVEEAAQQLINQFDAMDRSQDHINIPSEIVERLRDALK